MLERQMSGSSSPGAVPAASADTRAITVECLDGSVVRLQAEGTDTMAEVRHVALAQTLGGAAPGVESAYTVLCAGAVIDPATTVHQLVGQGLPLELNLIKPGAWGEGPDHA